MTDTRDDFEAHFKLCIRQQMRHKDDSYRDTLIQAKWEGWQSRGEQVAQGNRKPVAWAVWMNFDGEMRPTVPVFFEEEGAQRQQAIYGGEIVPLYR